MRYLTPLLLFGLLLGCSDGIDPVTVPDGGGLELAEGNHPTGMSDPCDQAIHAIEAVLHRLPKGSPAYAAVKDVLGRLLIGDCDCGNAVAAMRETIDALGKKAPDGLLRAYKRLLHRCGLHK